MIFKPYDYQQFAIDHVMDNPAAGLFLDMGLGKTVITLTAIDQLMFDSFEIKKVLVIAPKKVAENTWTAEKSKWDHLKHLRISKVLGDERQRKTALLVKADIYIINRENVAWLIGYYGTAFPFDMLVVDELSSFKDAKSVRFRALRRIRPLIKRVVGLTGTPSPNSLLELWPEMYLLDMGKRLGETLVEFREKFFTKDPYKPFDNYIVRTETADDLIGEGYYERKIYNKISDICISMKASDYLQLPPRIDRNVYIDLPAKVMAQYEDFEEQQVMKLASTEINAVNAAVLTGKLLQFANGALYDDDKNWHEVHTEKLEALEEELESVQGQPVLCFYSYRHDLERIMKRFKKYSPVQLLSETDIANWNKRKIPLALAHPASTGHGLNLQDGGHIIDWFGPIFSLELTMQAVARLDRQGQTKSVLNNRLIARGTMDEWVLNVIDGKEKRQDALLRAVKALVSKYRVPA